MQENKNLNLKLEACIRKHMVCILIYMIQSGLHRHHRGEGGGGGRGVKRAIATWGRRVERFKLPGSGEEP